MKDNRFTIRSSDPDVAEALSSFGHKRSAIIECLIREALDEGGGFLPGWVLAETGFKYPKGKRKKRVNAVHRKRNEIDEEKAVTKKDMSNPSSPVFLSSDPVSGPSDEVKTEPVKAVKTEPVAETVPEEKKDSVPDKNLIMAGLSAFGMSSD